MAECAETEVAASMASHRRGGRHGMASGWLAGSCTAVAGVADAATWRLHG